MSDYRLSVEVIPKINARVKLFLTLALILTVSLLPIAAWAAYILSYAIVFSLEYISRKGINYYLKRSLFVLPFILSALPLVFTAPSYTWYTLPFTKLDVSLNGIERLGSIIIKTWLSVQAAAILSSTTSTVDILAALRHYKLPRIFVEIISLMLRYLFILQDEAERLLRARASRSPVILGNGVTSGGTVFWRAKVSGTMVGSLMLRSFERGERVYQAMLSRGYDGETLVSEANGLKPNDWMILIVGMSSLFVLLIFGIWSV